MADPELPDRFIFAGKGRSLRQRMSEQRRIEVQPQSVFLREIDPRLKMLRLELIAVHFLTRLKHGIAGMQIQPVLSGDQAQRRFNILLQLRKIPRAAGIIAGRLNAAGNRSGTVEADHIVALPTMNRDGNSGKRVQRRFHIDSQKRVIRSRQLKSF